MNTKYTKGPWTSLRSSSAGHYIVASEIVPLDVCVVSKHGKSAEEIHANYCLIAAAPMLAEALEAYESMFDQLFGHCLSNGIYNQWGKPFDCTSLNDAHLAAGKALAAVRGEK